ncbi:hypothetical protein ACKW6Q_00945 [Chryseobacterium kwangjuense]|uniref:Uncharacterized protein n=1 Tax=Chryseobacterium kwangjuense TaxID=267125 RepID=A0ABW9JWW7_9FLAO
MTHFIHKITAPAVIFVSFLLPASAYAQDGDSFVQNFRSEEPAPVSHKAFFKFEFNKRLNYTLIHSNTQSTDQDTEVSENIEYYVNDADLSVLSYNSSRNGVIYNLKRETNPVLPVLIKDENKEIKPENFDYFKGDIPLESEISTVRKRKKAKTDQILELVEKRTENNLIHYRYNLIHYKKRKINLGVIELDITDTGHDFNNNILFDMEPLFFKNKIVFDKGEIKSYAYYNTSKKRTKYYESKDSNPAFLKLSFTKGCCVSSLE